MTKKKEISVKMTIKKMNVVAKKGDQNAQDMNKKKKERKIKQK